MHIGSGGRSTQMFYLSKVVILQCKKAKYTSSNTSKNIIFSEWATSVLADKDRANLFFFI